MFKASNPTQLKDTTGFLNTKIQPKIKPSTFQFTPATLFVHPKATSGSNSSAYFHHPPSFKIPLGLSSSHTICWRYLPYLDLLALPLAGACVLSLTKALCPVAFWKTQTLATEGPFGLVTFLPFAFRNILLITRSKVHRELLLSVGKPC